MMNTQHTTDDRGQVGIGTLIVFIAMVLVAAIAAGVLINTAGFLQTQAEATGEESTEQVANNVEVISTIGDTGQVWEDDDAVFQGGGDSADFVEGDEPADNDVFNVRVTVQQSAGSDAIDMSEATIEYLSNEAETLTHADAEFDGGAIDDGTDLDGAESPVFLTRNVQGSNDVLDADDDRIEIVIPLGEYEDSSEFIDGDTQDLEQPDFLEEGDDAELVISTAVGSQRVVVVSAPDIISDDRDPAVAL